nr:MAG TPA: hypothetical protein [Caudoviricetes sp.]
MNSSITPRFPQARYCRNKPAQAEINAPVVGGIT